MPRTSIRAVNGSEFACTGRPSQRGMCQESTSHGANEGLRDDARNDPNEVSRDFHS